MKAGGITDRQTRDAPAPGKSPERPVDQGGPVVSSLKGRPARFLVAVTLSSYGDFLSAVAVAVLLYRLTGLVAASAAYTVVRFAPRLLGPGPGGLLADRFSPSRIVIAGALVQAALTGLLLVGSNARLPWVIYGAVGLSQLTSSAIRPLHPAILGHLLPPARRQAGNALYGAAISSSILVAPAIGAALLTVISPQWLIVVDGASFLVMAALVIGIRGPAKRDASLRADVHTPPAGARLLLTHPVLRLVTLSHLGSALAITATQALLVAAARDRFGGESHIGWLYSGVGVGSIIGAAVSGRWASPILTRRRLIISILGEMAGLVLFAASPTLPTAVAALALSSFAGLFGQTWGTTEIQRLVPHDNLGRAFGLLFQGLNVGMVIGAVAALALVNVVPWPTIVLGTAAVATFIALAGSVGRLAPASGESPAISAPDVSLELSGVRVHVPRSYFRAPGRQWTASFQRLTFPGGRSRHPGGINVVTDEQAKVINVLICDDHHFVRTGLADVLAGFPDLKVVGAAENGEQGVEMAVALEPDIVLMDISMPGIDGLEATRRVVEARPTSRVVMLTSYSGHERIVDALKAGAVGYLLKDAPPADIVRTIRSAASAVAVQPDI